MYPSNPKLLIPLWLLLLILTGSCSSTNVEKWQPVDLSFTAVTRDNPFEVTLSAVFTKPDGSRLETEGFYDGDDTWIVRVAPGMEGEWKYRTASSLKSLNGRKGTFICLPNTNHNVHGKLLVDPSNPHYFVMQDGTNPFLMGYECDFLWSLDLGKDSVDRTEHFLDKIRDAGFNYVVMNAFAYDTRWCEAHSGKYDFGPPVMIPWEGTMEDPDYSRMNTAYWKHYDKVVDALNKRGMTAHIMFKVYNKAVNWPERNSREDDLYFRYIVSRYAAYPNIVWDFSKEAYYEKNVDYKQGRLELIRKTDPWHHPVTMHDDKEITLGYYNDLIDFHADQYHGADRHTKSLEQRNYHEWPVMNIEFGYEHGPGGMDDHTYSKVQSPEEVIGRAWEIAMAGSYITYYYTNTAWDVIKYDETPPGYGYFKHFSGFFREVGFSGFVPAELTGEYASLTDDQPGTICMVKDGKEFIFYRPRAAAVVFPSVFQGKKTGGYWLNILTGEKVGIEGPGKESSAPPNAWNNQGAVLYLTLK